MSARHTPGATPRPPIGGPTRDDANAVSITSVLIVSPGDEPLLDRGEAEWPFLRVSDDRLRATAIGVLEAVDDGAYADGAVPIVGHVSVAVHCGD